MGQGRDKAKEFLSQNPDILAEVERLVREKLATSGAPATTETTEAPAEEE